MIAIMFYPFLYQQANFKEDCFPLKNIKPSLACRRIYYASESYYPPPPLLSQKNQFCNQSGGGGFLGVSSPFCLIFFPLDLYNFPVRHEEKINIAKEIRSTLFHKHEHIPVLFFLFLTFSHKKSNIHYI